MIRWLCIGLAGLGAACGTGAAQDEEPALGPAPNGSFSVVVIPDTQNYTDDNTRNPVFEAHTEWIAANLDPQRIAFVSHVGDIVDVNDHPQWQVARRCMDRLHGIVPYGISVGNHDMTAEGDSSLFQEYFGAGRFAGFAWYGGTYPGADGRPEISGSNANSYQLFSAEGLDFLFIHLECNAPDDVLAWADELFETYADRWVLVTTHMNLGPIERPTEPEGYFTDPKGRMRWAKRHGGRGNAPQQMWEKCFRKHKNLLAIFSGDQRRTTALYQTATGDHGNTVHELMSDYTSSGPLRIYRFIPAENRIDVITYDTTLGGRIADAAYVPGREHHQFTIHHPLRLPAALAADDHSGTP